MKEGNKRGLLPVEFSSSLNTRIIYRPTGRPDVCHEPVM
jgi:hypothetical protein